MIAILSNIVRKGRHPTSLFEKLISFPLFICEIIMFFVGFFLVSNLTPEDFGGEQRICNIWSDFLDNDSNKINFNFSKNESFLLEVHYKA